MKWDGPDNYLGPYHCLWFDEGEGNAMPVSPIDQIIDIHDATNDVGRKLIMQALRQKTVLTVATPSQDDADRLSNAEDGDVVRIRNSSPPSETSFGGPDAMNMNFLLQLLEIGDQAAGNLSMLAGQAAQSDTLGQDQMLADANNRRLRDMQSRVLDHLQGAIRDIMWWVINDPGLHERTTREVAGVEVPVELTARQIEENPDAFLDMNFEIDPYSLTGQTPSQQLSGMLNIVSQVVLPMLPMLEQQGMGIDARALIDRISELSGNPALNGLIVDTQQGMPVDAETQRSGEPRQAASTTRTNIRKSVSRDKTEEASQKRKADIAGMAAAAQRDNRT